MLIPEFQIKMIIKGPGDADFPGLFLENVGVIGNLTHNNIKVIIKYILNGIRNFIFAGDEPG